MSACRVDSAVSATSDDGVKLSWNQFQFSSKPRAFDLQRAEFQKRSPIAFNPKPPNTDDATQQVFEVAINSNSDQFWNNLRSHCTLQLQPLYAEMGTYFNNKPTEDMDRPIKKRSRFFNLVRNAKMAIAKVTSTSSSENKTSHWVIKSPPLNQEIYGTNLVTNLDEIYGSDQYLEYVPMLDIKLPRLLALLIQYLSQPRIIATQGLFRQSPREGRAKEWLTQIEQTGLQPTDLDHPLEAASLLKQWIREIKDGLFPEEHSQLMQSRCT
jgi:hypothetical protein